METFNLFLPLAKIDKETRTVSGYASTPSLDLDGEIVSLDAVKNALPGYWEWRNIREMHQPSAVGVAKEANVDSEGLYLTSKIVDDAAWNKVLEGVYKGYSIGGRKLAKTGNIITEIELIEVSIVDRPANPDCRISVAKRAKKAGEAFLVKAAKPPKNDLVKALKKMSQVAETLAKDGPPAAHDGFSLPAKVETKKPEEPKAETLDTEKREFSDKQRQSLASQGIALPDGSYPIANKSDLQNAIQAFGRAKDKKKAKKHIIRRAKALGHSDLIPENWNKQAKVETKTVVKHSSAQPLFLKLKKSKGAEDGLELRGGGILTLSSGLSHNSSGNNGVDDDLEKNMGTVSELSCAFDSIRRAQRCLMFEAQREGGDRKDAQIAKELGTVSKSLAELISRKAAHEGQEALDLSDADDQGLGLSFDEDLKMTVNAGNLDSMILNVIKRAAQPTRKQRMDMAQDNLRKANRARKNARGAVRDLHKMHKGAYLSKASSKDKKPDADGDFDHASAMAKLQKAYGEIEKLGTFVKAAREQLNKVSRSGQRGQEAGDSESGFYEVPPGVKDLTPDAMAGAKPATSGSGGLPPAYPGQEGKDPGSVYEGKYAKFVKNGMVPADVAELIAENARLETISKLPATSGSRPYAFNVTKFANGGGGSADGFDPLTKAANKVGVSVAALANGDATDPRWKSATSSVIGNYLLEGGTGKQIVTDPDFRGTAGVKAA